MQILALIYHDVSPPEKRRETGFQGPGPDHYKLTPEAFRAQLAALPDDVVLTFDDGGASALDTVAPILAEAGRKGRFFIVTSRIGTTGFLSAAGCRELHEAGHLVGSHTVSHEPMTSMDDGRIRDEWARSKEALEQILGAPVTAGSVPRGFYSRRVGRIAIAAGYDTLFTSEPRTRPRQLAGGTVYGRFSVHEGTALAHVAALGRRSRRAIVHDAAAWNARKAAKRALGPVYERLRTTRLASGRP
jgi:peptidoglycan/xylan/chitin deacetylase (PgdA/CDA1 family)